MVYLLKSAISITMMIFLIGCTHTALKAPCNESGSNCWPRTKINQWNNGN